MMNVLIMNEYWDAERANTATAWDIQHGTKCLSLCLIKSR